MNKIVQSRYVANNRYLVRNYQNSNKKAKHLCTVNRHQNFQPPTAAANISLYSSSANVLFNRQTFESNPLYYNGHYLTISFARNFSTTLAFYEKEPLKPSSKVEVTVQNIKKEKEEPPKQVAVKKPLLQRIKDELIHYYHGFRLLFIDIKISSTLIWRVLHGETLTRREHRLLMRTVGDMFRLVPFSVFIIVPFMEFTLPFFIKFFPGMLPSTFESASDKEAKMKQSLKVKLEMAKFLQQTLDDMTLLHKDRNSKLAKEFKEWFLKVRTSGEQVTSEEIMKYSKLFEDEQTLDSLTRGQLVALCRVLEVHTLGTTNMLRFQLRMKLRSLAADDKMIQKEGLDSLTLSEVQQACRARGMRSYGLSEARLRSQLQQWLDLSLNKKVPASLLLLSRALMLPETIPPEDQLKATISVLPQSLGTQTQASIGEKEGKIDNKIKIEILKEEERKVKEERREECKRKEQEKKEILVDKAPTIRAEETPPIVDKAEVICTAKEKILEAKPIKCEEFGIQDLEVFKKALETVSEEKKFLLEKEKIEVLKEEMADYQEDLQDFKKVIADEPKPNIKESKAAKRLYNRVNKMISKMDKLIVQLEDKEKKLKEAISSQIGEKEMPTDDLGKEKMMDPIQKKKEELLKIDDLLAAIRKIRQAPDESQLNLTKKLLQIMDDDRDGSIKVEDVLKVLEIIGKDNIKLSSKQWQELIELIGKEEVLEVEEKIEKALQKEKDEEDKPASATDACPTLQPVGKAKSECNSKTDGTPKNKDPYDKDKPGCSPSKSGCSPSKSGCSPSKPKSKLDTQANIPLPPSLEKMQSPKDKKIL